MGIDKERWRLALERSRSYIDDVEAGEAELHGSDLRRLWDNYRIRPSDILLGEIERDTLSKLRAIEETPISVQLTTDFIYLPPHARREVMQFARNMISMYQSLQTSNEHPQQELDLD